ncbi:MAG: hypothetical protein AAFQ19_05910 [Pseudomonadota bacterium]
MDFDAVLDEIKDGIVVLVKTAIKTFAEDAKADLLGFVEDSKADLKRYAEMLARGDLHKLEFEFLVKAQVTNAKLLALSAKGIAKARLKHLRDSLKDLILRSVFAAL